MASLGSLVVSLAANTAAFTSDLGKAAHISERNMARIRRDAERAGKAIALMFAAGAATAAVLVKQAIDSQDAMLKMAQGAGVTSETFSELAFAAELAGVNVEAFSTSITRLNRNISDTAAKTGEARQAFAALGIDVKNADGSLKNADQVMGEVAEQFKQMEDGAGKSAIAVMLFGRAGAAMIPFLNQGADGMRQLREEAVALGASISTEAGQAAERFNDNLTRLNQVKKGLANTIAQELLPVLNQLTDQFVDTAKGSTLLKDTAQQTADALRVLLTGGTLIFTVFKRIGEGLGALLASAAAVIRGDLSEAIETLKLRQQDLAEQNQAVATAILDIWDKTARAAENASERTAKAAAPMVQSIEQVNKARKEALRLVKEQEKAEQAFADLMAKAAMKRQEMQEAAEARATEAHELETELRQRNIDAVVESLLTEEERELESYERRAEMIQDAYDRMLISQEEAQGIAEKLAAQHEKRMADIKKRNLTDIEKFNAMSWQKQTQTILGELVNLTAGVAQHSKSMFDLNKAAGIANAIINAYIGISKTLATYPFPFNIALAAAHAVVAFAQVRAISSQSFQGGGGAAPSLAGATAATPVTPVSQGAPPVLGTQAQEQARPPIEVTLILQGGRASQRAALEELLGEMQELTQDGFPVRFTQKTA
jgi:hypothetical protein